MRAFLAEMAVWWWTRFAEKFRDRGGQNTLNFIAERRGGEDRSSKVLDFPSRFQCLKQFQCRCRRAEGDRIRKVDPATDAQAGFQCRRGQGAAAVANAKRNSHILFTVSETVRPKRPKYGSRTVKIRLAFVLGNSRRDGRRKWLCRNQRTFSLVNITPITWCGK